jgi:LPXTG-site transpeptidase (sortase) family protein
MEYTNIDNKNDKKKKNKVTIILLIVAGLFFVAGVIFLLIDPVRSWRRMQVTEDALTSIESLISQNSANHETTPMTIVVPRDGNEVAGESYDYFVDDEELIELEEEVEQKDAKLPKNIELTCIGVLKIDKIDLSLPCWSVATRVALRYGLGHYEYSVMPGEEGNSTILGHRNRHTSTMFYRLSEVRKGDKVSFVKQDGTKLDYKVKEVRFCSPKKLVDNIVSGASDSEQLTLVSCATELGKGYRRLVICVPA